VEVGLSPGHIVLDEDPAPLPHRGAATPYFRPMSVVAKWMDELRCHLEVGLSPGDADPHPLPQKGAEPPVFILCLLWPNGWMDQDGTWQVGLGPGHIVQEGDPAPLLKRGRAPNLWPVSIVAKRLDGSR